MSFDVRSAADYDCASGTGFMHGKPTPPPKTRSRDQLIDWFLENACPDHHVRGGPDHIMARHTAALILQQNPWIARANIHSAVVCGEVDEVRRLLARNPGLVRAKRAGENTVRSAGGGSGDRFHGDLGPKDWDPLLFLCFARLPLETAVANSVDIARLLLDHGADPNSHFMAGDSVYTPLTGITGGGEEGRPPHPMRDAIAHLLLEHGAEPYDIQVVYDVSFSGESLWFLRLIHPYALKRGRAADWDDPEWSMLNMGNYGSGARWHLSHAISDNDVALARWCLEHGANPSSAAARDRRFVQRSLHAEATRAGVHEIAALLVRHGAVPDSSPQTDFERYAAACFALDRNAARSLTSAHPEYLSAPSVLMIAAKQNRADVVEFLLDLGVSPDIADPENGGESALHAAAWGDAPDVIRLLIARGANVDPFDQVHGGTPLWFALYGTRERAIDALRPHSRDIWSLSLLGDVERVRAVLHAQPALAKAGTSTGDTPLMYLPGEPAKAVELATLFLSLGADPALRNSDGLTAAELAEMRELHEAAAILRSV